MKTVYLLGSIFIGTYLNSEFAKADIKRDIKKNELAGYYVKEADYSIS